MMIFACRACGARSQSLRTCRKCGVLDAYVAISQSSSDRRPGRLERRVERLEVNA